jgi:hypothetical protein
MGDDQHRLDVGPHHRAAAEKAYAVEPVGVAITTPSQPQVGQGTSVDLEGDLEMRSREAFSTVTSFSAQFRAIHLPVVGGGPVPGVIRSSTT